ncbi:single-stranded DNA-binding protein [Sporosarcina sp. Te-1]|uniref:single-stranded DNA-binding protein n=1 Tax=Sporosarcina sp. Te-1 TaxID=2818390 RepID=UPI001A9ED7D2|nr:single-stranded DNA-binding protein [Sporosarcina sp. Te-1]QTD40783.1 single-stranded DNA-binding protein [Sporosarcina sp. Te-1]
MNQVALVGRITKDPILRRLPEGRQQSSFVLAVNRNFKNQRGEIEADFVLCTAWGKLAENTAKHCGKGSLIGISGRIQSRTYEREDRTRAFVTEVIAEEVRFLATQKRADENLYGQSAGRPQSEVGKGQDEEYVKAHFHLTEKEKEELPIF